MNEVGKTYQRPWGTYQTLAIASGYQVKILTVTPGSRLSLQRHRQRAEHWVVVKGSPTLTIGNQTHAYSVDTAVYIPVGVLHRIENLSHDNVVLVEVQVGEYLGEDDIERVEDIYGRS